MFYSIILAIGTVEDEFGTAGALVVDTSSDADLLVLDDIARLEVGELFVELVVIIVDLELVGVGVRLGVLEDYRTREAMSQ